MKSRSPKKTKPTRKSSLKIKSKPKTKIKEKEDHLLPIRPLPILFPLPPFSNRKRISFFLFFNILFFFQCSSLQEKPREVYHNNLVTTETEVLSKIEKLQNSGIQSLAYMYMLGDGVIHAGNQGGEESVQIQRFKIGSITKLFTGIALLQLQDKGKLKLDDQVSKYLPEIKMIQSRGKNFPEITLRDILTHQSGLPSDLASGFFLSPEANDKEILESFRSLPKHLIHIERNEPHKNHSYSNFGFGLLGVVIERVSGLGIEEYFQKEIFKKAGMKHSTLLEFYEGSDLAPGYHGFFWKTKTKPQKIRDLTAGSLSSTGEDMGFFMKALFQSKKGKGLLSKESFAEFHRIQKGPSSNFQMKLGLPVLLQEKISGGKTVWISGHSGSLPPYFADLVYDPETEIVSFLAGNTTGFATAEIQPTNKEILDILFEYKTGNSLEPVPLPKRKDQNRLDGYFGLYVSPFGIHELKEGNPPKLEIMGFDFDLVEKENRFGTNLLLFFGLIPIKDKSLESFRIEFETWDHEQIFTLYSTNMVKGSLGFAHRFQPNQNLPAESYFTRYSTKDPHSLIPRVELAKDKRGFLLFSINYSLGGLSYSTTLPCQMESATNLRILGYGRNLGERLEIKKFAEKPVLVYSGIEFIGD
ncbi:class A beta-lactamase-related serine hydrolase [Leptospira noumeaensis]|uniref:Class A beta-lactamase-related serine hydrolase n=1 Tax=Leptospira noumeaensis TaxID=2484964 RepID=A0A4R9I8T0_9LEPT|nr:serine hydrolase domain-containing protein [Leptospira noumeaensis]TGK82483.1 class A beta-lactamase-related serine hydrolase [Leptospira noumeaensis]